MTPAKRVMYVVGGALWFLFSLGFGLILVDYITGGAGLQFFGGPVSSGSVLLGLAHLTGFAAAIVICFAIGAGLCARGLVSHREHEQDKHRA
jgi:membrane protein implicated in regulation of membrane protease activity